MKSIGRTFVALVCLGLICLASTHAQFVRIEETGAGRITTGRQLFGPMTWQIHFRDGYEALSMLDRNHDGQLTGDELGSIALWQDKNGNAVSDAGEVVPLDQAGIIAIDLKANRDAAGVLNAPAGIHWRDGHTTASFDWVPESK